VEGASPSFTPHQYMAEIEAIESDVRYFLLPTEEVKVVAECIVVHSPQLSDQETKPVFIEQRIKRVLAVISHHGGAYQTHEQGWSVFPSHMSPLGPFRLGNSWFPISLFIFKFKSTDIVEGGNPSAELVIDHVIPISGDFSISVALSKRNTIDLRNPSSPLTRNQPRTGTRLSVSFPHHPPPFLPLCRLIDVAEHLPHSRNRRFSLHRTKGHNQSRPSVHP
jgi:hypothetical protein